MQWPLRSWKQAVIWVVAVALPACGGGQQQAAPMDGSPQARTDSTVAAPARTRSALSSATSSAGVLSGLLPGTQIVVTLGNGTTLPLQQDGFFNIEYSDDTERSLEIISQPARQSCTINGDVGRVAFGRDETPRIECLLQEAQLNGYVTGLSAAAGLELRLAGE